MVSYLIAKYVDDLTRDEPINIGVIAYDGTRVSARFDGEDERNYIDLRRVRHRITGSHAYRAWVRYWRRALAEPKTLDRSLVDVPGGDERVVERLVGMPSGDFSLQRGGTILLDAEPRPLPELVDDLFARLVREAEPPVPPSLREKSREALLTAGAPLEDEARFKEQYPISLDIAGESVEEEVSFAVQNGRWNYLQEVSFDPQKPLRSRKEASYCLFLFEHADIANQGLYLYDGSDVVPQSYRYLELLRRYAPTIDVDRTDSAAEQLQARLGLSHS